MANVGRTVESAWKRKRIIGLVLLAVGALIFLTGSTETLSKILGFSVSLIAFLLIIAGVVLLLVRRRPQT